MAYTLYILQSDKDDSYYIGYSSDMAIRLTFHNEGLSQFTSAKRLWRIVYTEEFDAKSEAMKREKFIKRQKSRAYIQELVSSK